MKKRLLFFIILIMGILPSCAPRQEIKPDVPVKAMAPLEELKLPDISQVQKAESKKEDKKIEKISTEKKADEQYIMLNFENADLETVISTVSEMLKINYILSPGVSGKITIQSTNKIPLSELFQTFQTILEFNGFTAVKDGSFYRIVPIDTAKQQPVPIQAGKTLFAQKDSGFVTQEIPLEYVKANDVANIVRNLMPRGTDIVVYEPSNMLIITATPMGIMKFLKLLEAIDIPASERDAVRTFVYYVENGEAKKLADILRNTYAKKTQTGTPVKTVSPTPGAPTPVPVPSVTTRPRTPVTGATVQEGLAGEIEGDILIEAYEDINAIIIKTTPRGYLALLETIRRLDVQPKQVLIEVLIAEITLDDTTKFGIEWLASGLLPGSSAGIIGGVAEVPANFLKSVTTGGTGTGTGTGTGGTTSPSTTTTEMSFVPVLSSGTFANVIDPGRFNALLTAAATNDKINVLASPHILALDNKEAKIEIADEVPVATSITQPSAGATTTITSTSQVQFKSAGTILTVTPHINEKKQVTLKITQEVSELGAKVPIGGQDFQGFKTRKANTTAIVQDGHTLVIGGIINERIQNTRKGIPLLSQIPLFGYLFGTTTDINQRKELILMVTPHVVQNHTEADELTKEFESKIKVIKGRHQKKDKTGETENSNAKEGN